MLDSSFFSYDQQIPFALMVLAEDIQDGARLQEITYASPCRGKVSAYLILPTDQAPRAGLIFGHWGQGNREEFVKEAILLAELGIVSLCLDAPYRRPPEYEPLLEEPPQAELQLLIDIRRGVDLLQEQFSFAPGQLGYVGHSYCASFGGVLAGIEHRISAYVLMVGFYAMTEVLRTSTKPVWVENRKATPLEDFEAYLAALAPLDALHYINHADPSSLFFQFAQNDEFVSLEEGQRYFNIASEPKQIAWYDDCGHELNGQARLDRIIWLCAQFGLPSPSEEFLKRLQQVPSPVPLE